MHNKVYLKTEFVTFRPQVTHFDTITGLSPYRIGLSEGREFQPSKELQGDDSMKFRNLLAATAAASLAATPVIASAAPVAERAAAPVAGESELGGGSVILALLAAAAIIAGIIIAVGGNDDEPISA